MINNELFNKYPYVVTEQAHLIILDRKSAISMAKNGMETKQTNKISRIMHFAINDED